MNYSVCLILVILEVSSGTPIDLNVVLNYVIHNPENLKEFEKNVWEAHKGQHFLLLRTLPLWKHPIITANTHVRKHDVLS